MTFFTKYSPAPSDKKCHSKHQTLFPLFRKGLGTRLYMYTADVGVAWVWLIAFLRILQKSVTGSLDSHSL